MFSKLDTPVIAFNLSRGTNHLRNEIFIILQWYNHAHRVNKLFLPNNIYQIIYLTPNFLLYSHFIERSHFFLIVPPHVAPLEFSDNPINSDEMVSVSCIVAKGDFPIDIIWLLNGQVIENFPGISIVKTNKRISQLNIDSVQAEHAGEYTCLSKNSAGATSSATVLHVNGTH